MLLEILYIIFGISAFGLFCALAIQYLFLLAHIFNNRATTMKFQNFFQRFREFKKYEPISYKMEELLDKRKLVEKKIYNNQDIPSKRPAWGDQWDKTCMDLVLKEQQEYIKTRAIKYLGGKDILILGGGRSESQMIKNIKYKTLYFINISEIEIEKSKEHYPKDTIFVVGDAENTGFDNNKFDVIICHSILHHLDIDKALKEIKRILKKEGIVFVANEPAALNLIAFIGRKFFPTNIHTPNERPFIIKIFRKKLRQYGFKEVEFESFSLFSPAIPVIIKQLKVEKALNLEKLLKLILDFEKKIRNFAVIREFCWTFSALYKKEI